MERYDEILGADRVLRRLLNKKPPLRRMTTRAERIADWTAPLAAVFAALCCLGVSFIVAGLAAAGLSFLRSDPILWPLMIVSILIALWGMWRGLRTHGSAGPFVVALLSGTALVAGVIFVHGFPARELIYAGSAGLIGATIWNAGARRRWLNDLM